MINELPTVFEVVTDRKPAKDKSGVDSGSKSRHSTKVRYLKISIYRFYSLFLIHSLFFSDQVMGSRKTIQKQLTRGMAKTMMNTVKPSVEFVVATTVQMSSGLHVMYARGGSMGSV